MATKNELGPEVQRRMVAELQGRGTRWWLPRVAGLGLFVASCLLRPDVAVALVVLGAAFTVVERVRPLRHQPAAVARSGSGTDAVHFVVDEVLAAAGLVVALWVLLPIVRFGLPEVVPAAIRAQPTVLIWAESLLFAEVAGYWGHRLTHQVPFLWRFHRVHHSSPSLDWLSPNRRHPLDQVVARVSVALPVLAMGFAVPTVVAHFALKRIQGLLVHANVDLRLGPLEWVVASPHFHHWHHSDDPGTWNRNYAGQLPLVDWVFGTHQRPDGWPETYGCDGYVPPRGYLAQLLAPWTARGSVPSDAQRVDLEAEAAGRTGHERQRVAQDLVVRGLEPPRTVDGTLDLDARRVAEGRHERP
ncbi:hypothetical protein BH10ACT1_BH10ACT1_15940 [soil metagenome]